MERAPYPVQTWNDLEAVAAAVRECRKCGLCQGRINAVPGEGSSSASIMFIGEGPGSNEDQQGRPFVGRAGKLLDELLTTVPLKRGDVFITNVVKCRPPDNRDPLPEEVAACWPYLEAQLALIRPRVIATLGRHSMYRFFPEGKISRDHGRTMRWRDTVVYPLYHPAAALRSSAVMEALAQDFARLPEAIVESLKIEPDRLAVAVAGAGAPARTSAAADSRPGMPAAQSKQHTPPFPAAGQADEKQQLSMF